MSALRVLFTGGRDYLDRATIRRSLGWALATYTSIGTPVLVHGGARGADTIAGEEWAALGIHVPGGLSVEVYRGGADPLGRNLLMVRLGATVCLAHATRWAGGTGHCARAARRAGIHTVDFGVDTRIAACPRLARGVL